MTERGLIEVDRSYVIAEFRAHEPCKVDMTILTFIENQSDEKPKGEAAISEMARTKGGTLTYDDRRLAQDYVRSLPRILREYTTVEPGRGIFREEKGCEGNENDKNRC